MGIRADHFRKYVVRPTLKAMGMWSEAAENLLMGTAAQESALGYSLKQIGGGPAVGVFQIEPETARDLVHRYLLRPDRQSVDDQFQKAFQLVNSHEIDWSKVSIEQVELKLITDLRFSCAMARLRYKIVPAPLPPANDLNAQGEYYKKYYNSAGGKGSAEDYIENYQRLVN